MKISLDNGRKRKHSLRQIANAILYLTKIGVQWRYLPKDYPNWKLVYYYFSQWAANGKLEELHDQVVEKLRKKKGKQANPSLLLLDSQTVKTGSMTEEKGFDGTEFIKAVKNTLGYLLEIVCKVAGIPGFQVLPKRWIVAAVEQREHLDVGCSTED